MRPPRLLARGRAAVLGWRWASRQLAELRRTLGPEGLGAQVAPPPTIARGSLRGARASLDRAHASCLERSFVLQSWIAANGVGLDVIVGVRRADIEEGDLAHAWIDQFDEDCSDRYAEIRRVPARNVVARPNAPHPRNP